MAPGFPCPLPPEEKGSRSLVSRAHSRFVNSYQRASEPTVPTNLCFPGRRAIRLHLQGAFGSLRFGTLRIPKRFRSGSLTSAWGIRTGVKANLGSLPEARKRAENFFDQIRHLRAESSSHEHSTEAVPIASLWRFSRSGLTTSPSIGDYRSNAEQFACGLLLRRIS